MTTERPHRFATATAERVPARHSVNRARGSVADWQPHGDAHAVARDTSSGLCQNTTLCGLSVYNLHLFADLAYDRGAATCHDCSTIAMSRLRVRSPVSPAS